MGKPDPVLLPVQRPRCPRCQARMSTIDLSPGPEGFEHRTVECSKCGYSEETVAACDPLRSNAVGWLASELKPPN
jgi:tRNA(Ile2) C34 agmatinyltransferase TiaS